MNLDYEKRYKMALEKARELLSCCIDDRDKRTKIYRIEDIESIFPELLESNDERIRKELIENFKWFCGNHSETTKWGKDDDLFVKDIIAWLEKQKDYIKLPNSAYTSNRDVKEFADKYSHTIWENLMDNFKKIENYSIGCNDVSDLVLNAIIHTYYWLEKQGEIDLEHYKDSENEKRKFVGYGFLKCKGDFLSFKEGETYWLEYIGKDNYNVRSDNLFGQTFHIKPVELYTVFRPTTWLEKQGEQEPTDKIEPKFKVRDWITDEQLICKVLSVTGKSYELHLYNDDYCHFETDVQSVDKHYRLWTIADAKRR